eukprot:Em0020g699a
MPYGRHHHRYRGGNRRKGGLLFFLIAAALVILIVPATVTYQDHGSPLYRVLSPGDTRIVSHFSSVCQGVTLSSSSPSVNSTLYFLSKAPILGAMNTFVLSSRQTALASGSYQYWSFRLYPGSQYSLAACLNFGHSVEYYVIKGTSNFNNWVKYPADSRAIRNSILYLNNLCDTFNVTGSLTFTVEDVYYFIFYNLNSVGFSASVQVTFSFDRTEYLPGSGSIVSNCTATAFSSCSLNIPYNSDYTMLLQTSPPSDGDWGANVGITTSCVERGWVYAVIEISMIALVAVGAILVVAFFYRDRIKSGCTRGTHTFQVDHTTPTTLESAPTTANTSALASEVDFLVTSPPIGFQDAPSESVLTPPPPPDYANSKLDPPPQDYKDTLPPDYKDEPPPPY